MGVIILFLTNFAWGQTQAPQISTTYHFSNCLNSFLTKLPVNYLSPSHQNAVSPIGVEGYFLLMNYNGVRYIGYLGDRKLHAIQASSVGSYSFKTVYPNNSIMMSSTTNLESFLASTPGDYHPNEESVDIVNKVSVQKFANDKPYYKAFQQLFVEKAEELENYYVNKGTYDADTLLMIEGTCTQIPDAKIAASFTSAIAKIRAQCKVNKVQKYIPPDATRYQLQKLKQVPAR